MKIVQMTTFFAPVVGGVETQVEDLSKQLLENGHEVSVLTSDSSHDGHRLESPASEYAGVPVKRLRTLMHFSKFHKFIPDVFRELMSSDWDIVHVHGLRKPEMYMALLAAKLKRKKIVVSTHNPFVTTGRNRKMRVFIALHDIFLGFPLMRWIDHYFLLTQDEAPQLKKFGVKESKMTVMGNGINDEFFQSQDQPEASSRELSLEKLLIENGLSTRKKWKAVVLGVGRIAQRKGFQYLQKAMEQLDRVLFLIVGADGGYMPQLKRITRDLDNVILTEKFETRENLIKYYQLADIFVLPSKYEPFGIVLLEAMAQKLPVIATNKGGPQEILEAKSANKAGILVDAQDQDAWLEAIQGLVDNQEKSVELGDNAYNRAMDFRWEKLIKKYLGIYQKLMS